MINGTTSTQGKPQTSLEALGVEEVTDIKVYKTTNYGLFKLIRGNRSVSRPHLGNLTKSVAKHNLLPYEPILVNEKFEIADGQHRFTLNQENKYPVYFIQCDGLTLKDVQLLNSHTRNWTGRDYMESYASMGVKSYQVLKSLTSSFGLNINTVLILSQKVDKGESLWSVFKKGTFVPEDEQDWEDRTIAYSKLKSFCETRSIYNDRDFVRAVLKLMEKFPVEELLARLQTSNRKLTYHEKVRDYLREFEDVLNFRRSKNIDRLY